VRECLLEDLFVLQLLDDRMGLIVPCVPHVPGISTCVKHFECWKTARGRKDGSETPSELVPVISVLAQHGQHFPFVRPPLAHADEFASRCHRRIGKKLLNRRRVFYQSLPRAIVDV